jgi:hypothetical protein
MLDPTLVMHVGVEIASESCPILPMEQKIPQHRMDLPFHMQLPYVFTDKKVNRMESLELGMHYIELYLGMR